MFESHLLTVSQGRLRFKYYIQKICRFLVQIAETCDHFVQNRFDVASIPLKADTNQ